MRLGSVLALGLCVGGLASCGTEPLVLDDVDHVREPIADAASIGELSRRPHTAPTSRLVSTARGERPARSSGATETVDTELESVDDDGSVGPGEPAQEAGTPPTTEIGPADPEPPPPEPVREEFAIAPLPQEPAVVAGCDDIDVHDSGFVLTLVRSPLCPPLAPDVAAEVVLSTDGLTTWRTTAQLGVLTAEHDIRGLGVRVIEVVDKGQWRSYPNDDTWAGRDGAGLLVLRGELYLLGGWTYGPVNSEVWRSKDGLHWELLGHAPWPPRHCAGWLVHDDRLWVVGGDLYDDVWSSPDGVEWHQEAEHAPFGRRYAPSVASVNGAMLVFAGNDWPAHIARGFPDVWRSVDGRDWTLATESVPWQPRGLIHGSAVWNGEAYLIGGGLKQTTPGERLADTVLELTDIWTTTDGATWTKRADASAFAPRTHFSVASSPMGCFVSDGSQEHQTNLTRDLYLARDCVNYEPIDVPIEVEVRHASSFAWWNGRVIVTGGPPGSGTTIWHYFP